MTARIVPTVVTRTLAGIALGIPVLLVVWWGTPVFEVMVALAAGILAGEWIRMTRAGAPRTHVWLLGGVLLVAIAIAASIGIAAALVILLVSTVLILLQTRGAPWITLGVLYIGLPCISLIWLRDDSVAGAAVVIWLLLVVWASDIGAYAAGRLIGGPKLAPRISPNKTWAGLVGGVVAAAVTSASFVAIVDGADPGPACLLGGTLAIVAQAGDLLESWVKRRFGVKDTGTLIPGHGGLLDRVDALLAVVLVVACIAAVDGGALTRWL